MASSLEMIRKQRRALQKSQEEASAADIKKYRKQIRAKRLTIFPVK